MSTQRQMPVYKSHKTVWALKIAAIEDPNHATDGSRLLSFVEPGYAPICVTGDYMSKHQPHEGGYYVVYKGGYTSFCPAKEFEEGNTLVKDPQIVSTEPFLADGKTTCADPAPVATPEIDAMVSRFLAWRLPADFAPDGYVSFNRASASEQGSTWPTGTNLLNAYQARAMLEHVIGIKTIANAAPSEPSQFPVPSCSAKSHQQRVIDERQEVGDRLTKLQAFFETVLFSTLDVAERVRLRNQALVMHNYVAILDERIEAFSPEPTMTGVQVETKTYADGTTATGPAPLPAASPVTDTSIESEIVAKGLTAPRVTMADIEAAISGCYYFTAADGASTQPIPGHHKELNLITFCVLVLRNGFIVTGESAVASPENFDAEIGRKIARQDAVRQVWPLLGFALRDKLAAAK